MSRHQMDADTAETLAGVVRLLRRVAEFVWAAVDADGAGSPRQMLGLGIDLPADEARNLLPDPRPVDGPMPVGDEPTSLLRSAEQLLRRVITPGAGTEPRETLLDATPDQALAMVRSWNQIGGVRGRIVGCLESGAGQPVGKDPMEQLRIIAEAIGCSATAGQWPAPGPTDEHLTQIADNLSAARHLVEPPGRPSQQAALEMQRDIQDLHGQVMHTLCVAAHETAVMAGCQECR
jgi:hypothetical protein